MGRSNLAKARRPTDQESDSPQAVADHNTLQFLADLTELSAKHGIAIGGEPVLFMMEQEDYQFSYRIDDESRLSLG